MCHAVLPEALEDSRSDGRTKMDSLPIDEVLHQIGETLERTPRLVLEAPPGAGKTTRVPWFLAERWGQGQGRGSGKVLVSEPRRIAAKLAAERVASELGERLGQTIGYSVRLEQVAGPDTRVLYVTDGVLLKRLVTDPGLADVGVVVLDEFHERRLQSDLSLALLKRLQDAGSKLKLLVMSATLDAAEVARYLDDCPRIQSSGRSYSVQVTHAPRPDERPLEKQVASAVRQLLSQTSGDLLVFLAGAREIRLCKQALAGVEQEHGLSVTPLHGELPLKEQTLAVRRQRFRKVVLATNVAESSVTIDNITGVVDSGTARMLIHDAWSGMDRLGIHKISQASALQRAGRAGRTSDGQVIRLYTKGDFDARPKSETPEIERLDLAESLLLLKTAELGDVSELPWLTPPKPTSLAAAEGLLRDLGATDPSGALTPTGKRLLAFPVHPRLARVIVEGEARGVAEEACLIAALLGERDIRSQRRSILGPGQVHDSDSDSDVLELLELYLEARANDFDSTTLRQLELEGRTLKLVSTTGNKLTRIARDRSDPPDDTEQRDERLLIATMTGFIDRLAQRAPPSRALLLANGKIAELGAESTVHRVPLLVAVDASDHAEQRQRGKTVVRVASRVDEQWLFDLYFDRLDDSEELEYNAQSERVERVSRIRFGRVTLDETRGVASPSEAAAELLFRAASSKGTHAFDAEGRVEQVLARMATRERLSPAPSAAAADSVSLAHVLRHACRSVVSLAELRASGLESALWDLVPAETLRTLDQDVPDFLILPGGRRLRVHYSDTGDPYVASRLQDFFSMTETPTICRGRVPLLLHLLAPNQRAVQVTRDLPSFWQTHYPELRRQLMRRYPRHSWPEDGRTAPPPPPRPPRPRER